VRGGCAFRAVGGGLRLGVALDDVRLHVVPVPPCSSSPTVAGCRLGEILLHVLGPKYERRQRPRNSQRFRIGKSRGNLAMTPDVAGVISLNRFMAPVDDNVTANSTLTKILRSCWTRPVGWRARCGRGVTPHQHWRRRVGRIDHHDRCSSYDTHVSSSSYDTLYTHMLVCIMTGVYECWCSSTLHIGWGL